MPGMATSQTHAGQPSWMIGTPFTNEEWWRDHYYDIYDCGYELHRRYHPDWEPSWRGSGQKNFVGDERHANMVSLAFSVLSK